MTEPAPLGASAPGKLMISGEYAVLEGAVAVVAAVNARAFVRWVDQAPALPPEAAETRRLAELAEGVVAGALALDVRELRTSALELSASAATPPGKQREFGSGASPAHGAEADRFGRGSPQAHGEEADRPSLKLGLGSSAAASAAVAGAVLAARGHDLGTPAVQRRAFELALAGHKAIAPEGSGADVAAAALGGFVRFRLDGDRVAEAERIAFPAALEARVVWTGKEARTSEFVRAVRAFEARDARGYGFLRDELRDQAARFADAIARADVGEIIAATSAYGLAMGQLGRSAAINIITPELALIARLAEQHGGAAKPSGAGGGDVAIALFPSAASAVAFDLACAEAQLARLDLTLGAPGVRTE